MDFPTKQYDIIYADPPWVHEADILQHGVAGDQYDIMTQAQLCELPVKQISNPNSLMFMWVASPVLDYAFEIGTAWGFKYRTVAFVWDKQRPVCGQYTMSQCEMCLVFKRGQIPKPRGVMNVRQFLSTKRGQHSEKPWEVRDRITEMFPAQSKLEMFARTQHKGWDAWGNELDKEINLS